MDEWIYAHEIIREGTDEGHIRHAHKSARFFINVYFRNQKA